MANEHEQNAIEGGNTAPGFTSQGDQGLTPHSDPHEPNPSDPPARARAQERDDGGDEGSAPTPVPNPRDSIYSSFKRTRNTTNESIPTLTDGAPRDVVNPETLVDPEDTEELERQSSEEIERLTGRKLDDEARAAFGMRPGDGKPVDKAPVAPAPKPAEEGDRPITLKVNHQLYNVTLQQAADLAGLDVEEARSMKIDTLVKVAQISAANQLRTKQPTRDPEAAPQAPAQTDRTTQDYRSDGTPATNDDLDVTKLQIGTEEEARAEVDRYLTRKFDTEFSKRELAQREVKTRELIGQALNEFNAENEEILRDEKTGDYALARTTSGLITTLNDLGALSGRDLARLRANPEHITELYKHAVMHGLPVKSPKAILAEAAADAREFHRLRQSGQASPTPTPPPQSEPSKQSTAVASRIEAKRNLAQISSRSGNDVRPAQATSQMDKRSLAVANMRKARGQLTA